jgi:4-hydroxy-tetrahydrodipicolinate reductase
MKIGIFGATGRMGRTLIQVSDDIPLAEITAAVASDGSIRIGQDIGEVSGVGRMGVLITSNPDDAFSACDVGIDFSNHIASVRYARAAAASGKPLVIGTTGFTDEELDEIHVASYDCPIVLSPNMSVGINILSALVEKTSAMLDTMYDVEIVEMHHRGKVDAPSGTALALGRAVAKGRGIELEEAMRAGRVGNIGKRIEGEIGFASLRGGDVIGDHTVIFAGDGERIEFSHKATSREVFAYGAFRAASWVLNQENGFYTMKDVLGLNGE